MRTRRTPLAELGRHLVACADDALLDAPLDVLRVGDEEARDLLRGVCEAGDARTLRDLCGGDALER
nr:hypothetical protein [Myxococcota bacterium]